MQYTTFVRVIEPDSSENVWKMPVPPITLPMDMTVAVVKAVGTVVAIKKAGGTWKVPLGGTELDVDPAGVAIIEKTFPVVVK